MEQNKYVILQIGNVLKDVTGNCLEIFPKYKDGLLELGTYSHVHVYWWAHKLDEDHHRAVLVTDIPYAKEKTVAGVFACRSPERPNLIMDSICKIKGIAYSKGKIFIGNIDAFPDTPIIDIKPYIHCNDRVDKVVVPRWFPAEWGEWFPKDGIY